MDSRLKIAWKLLTAEQFAVITYKNNKINTCDAGGKTDLSGIMAMTIELLRMSKSLLSGVEEIATEEGELKTYLELLKTIKAIQDEK